jgi:hypothetical protein
MAVEAKIIFTPCCGDGDILEFNGVGGNWWSDTAQGTVWKYVPASPADASLEGCYIITSISVPLGTAPSNPVPENAEMTYLAQTCEDAANFDDSCDCGHTELIPCCDGDKSLYFQPTKDVFNPGDAYTYKDKNYTIIKSDAPAPISGSPDPFPGSGEIIATDQPCDDSECCSCIRVRSKNIIDAPISVVIVNCDGVNEGLTVWTNREWSDKVCARSWDLDPDIFEVEVFGDCIDDGLLPPSQICTIDICFLLEDCEGVEDDIYATYSSIEPYLDTNVNIITIDGFPGTCWSFREISECDCAIDVTVLTTWIDCETCRKCKGYKLTNCEDDTYVKYTTNDLSEYIGQTVEFEDCPGCWFVECLEIVPPSDQNLVVEFSFNDCDTCLRKFWKLTPCEGQVHDPIFTDTDLEPYVGFIITLDNIPGICFELEEVRDLEGFSFETVFVDEYFVDCDTCKVAITDCLCSTAVNGGSIAESLRYLDCTGVWIETAIIPSGTRSAKVCAVEWDLENAINIEWYGECTEVPSEDTMEPDTWKCPVLTPKLRSVKPGYDTPGCPADYFEKVSCKFAEALYKNVLADRYGITTNCSSEESNKWEIKKELLDLAAITNPDYDCPPISSCYDACAATAAFENCLTGDCFGYTITYEANAPDDITTYTDCETCEIITIEHVETDTIIVYTICVAPGTPIVTEGFLELLGECPEPLIPCSCSTYVGAVNNGAPGTIPYIGCDGIATEYIYPGAAGEWDAFTFCGQPGQTLVPSADKGFHFDEILCCGNAPICINSTLTFPVGLTSGVYSWLDCSGVAQVVSYPFVTTEYSVDVCAQQGTLFTDGPTVVEIGPCP